MVIGARTGCWSEGGSPEPVYNNWLMSDGTAGLVEDITAEVMDSYEILTSWMKDGTSFVNDDTAGWMSWSGGYLRLTTYYASSGRLGAFLALSNGLNYHEDIGVDSSYKRKFKLDPSTGFYVDDVLCASSFTPVKRGSPVRFAFFGLGQESSTYMRGICHGNVKKIYYAKHWRDGVLIRHWIPHLDGADACFCDLVTGSKIYGVSTSAENRSGIIFGTDAL